MVINSLISYHSRYPCRLGIIYTACVVIVASSVVLFSKGSQKTKPNIVIIVADDLGWDDVSFHGSNHTLTPNIDLLAYTGVTLGSYYTHCACSPSRAALLTGKFAHTTAMYGVPLRYFEDRGLPLSEKIMPQYLKELGYSTHLVGKWHLGQSRTAYTPTHRGFDSFFGHRGGFIDYYEYTNVEYTENRSYTGLDLFRNMTAAWDVEGYITDVYTEEARKVIMSQDESSPLFLMLGHNAVHCGISGSRLQAPPHVVRGLRHVESANRRIYAAMVKKLDDSVGTIMEALKEKDIIDNTIVVFISDNGGPTSGMTSNFAINYPLRGQKMTPFDGGVRVPGIVWSTNLNHNTHLWKGRMHVVDWLPTLLRAIGSETPSKIDGVDQWSSILLNGDSKRDEVFETSDYFSFSSIISGDYKLITGEADKSISDFQGSDLRDIIGSGPSYEDTLMKCKMYEILGAINRPFDLKSITIRNDMVVDCNESENNSGSLCYPNNGTFCLFNVTQDPCELRDLSETYPDVVERLASRLQEEMTRKLQKQWNSHDALPNPLYFNNTWMVWADDLPSVLS